MTAAAKPGRCEGGGSLDCRARDLVLMEGGATRAASVATWALVCTQGDVLIGVAAFRSCMACRFLRRSPLVELVGLFAGNGGRTSPTVAHCTTSTLRRRGVAKQAATCREDKDLQRSFQQSGQPPGQYTYGSKGKLAKLNYLEIKLLLDRHIVKNKRGSLSERKIQTLVKDWHDRCLEGDL